MKANSYSLMGRVGQNPKVIMHGSEGKKVATFSVALNRRKFDENEQKWIDIEPHWFDVACFGSLAERVSEQLSKGDFVHVDAYLSPNVYEKSGVKIYTTQIVAKNVLKIMPLYKNRYSEEDMVKMNVEEMLTEEVPF